MAEDSLLRVPKRPKNQTDVKIVVGDGEVEVHSVILILASPVFEKMLSSCMHEGSATEITLPGKKRSEFVTFYKALQLYSMEPLTEDSATFLSCWADEYQIEALKTKCEEYLVSSVPVDSSSLKHAMTYRMHKRVTQCVDTMKKDVVKYLDELGDLTEENTKEYMQVVWPALCEQAGIRLFPMPAPDQVHAMWPFLAVAVRLSKCAASAAALDRLRRDANHWAHQLQTSLSGHEVPIVIKNRARVFIVEKLKRHNISSIAV